MWGASEGLFVLIAIIIVFGIVSRPNQKKVRGHSRVESRVTDRSNAKDNPSNQTVTVNSSASTQASSGMPNSFLLPKQKSTSSRQRENEL